jgi:hypothetical protein
MANSLQAVLDSQKTNEAPKPNRGRKRTKPASQTPRSRQDTRLIGGHFSPDIARQIRILAAEVEMTVQALREEALSDLFVKKGKKAII